MSAIGKSMENPDSRKSLPFVDEAESVNEPDLCEWMLYNGSGRAMIDTPVGGVYARLLLSQALPHDHRAYIRNSRTGETISW